MLVIFVVKYIFLQILCGKWKKNLAQNEVILNYHKNCLPKKKTSFIFFLYPQFLFEILKQFFLSSEI